MLGWAVGPLGRHLYVRQLQDQKASAVVEVMTIDDLATWGQLCGWGAGPRPRPDRRARRRSPPISATTTPFDHAIAEFGAAYADQTEKDHAALLAAIKSGRVAAEMNV